MLRAYRLEAHGVSIDRGAGFAHDLRPAGQVLREQRRQLRRRRVGEFHPLRHQLKNPNGRGGRCSEYLLSLAIEMASAEGVYGLAADTDGIDGSEANAGAWFSPALVAAAMARGVRVDKLLAANDAYGFFERTGGLILTGPTRTNVNDSRAVLLV